jgi:DNA repair protein RadC
MSVVGWLPGEGPRERLLDHGATVLSDAELLAVLLHTGYRNCSALAMARGLLIEFAGIGGLMRAGQERLLSCPGVGPAKYARLCAALELARAR